jgi:hypothetical protein
MAHSNAAIRLTLLAVCLAGLPVAAQEISVRDQLLANVACAGRGQADMILANADRMVVEPDVVSAALTDINADRETCEAIQRAALDVSARLTQRAADQQAELQASARQRVEEALRAADAQAASASFQIRPPPRNLTGGVGLGD